MKIILTGTQGTGKTTMLRKLGDCGFNTKSELVRNLMKTQGLTINEDGTAHTQEVIFDAYLDQLNSEGDFVSDRGIVDVMGYTMWNLANVCSQGIQSEWNRERRLFKEFNSSHNDVVYIYFPIEFPVVADGVRPTDENYRKEVDRYIKGILDDYVGEYLTVSGTVDERYQQICKYIK